MNILVVMSQICLRYGNVNSDTKGHKIGKAAEESDYGSNPAIQRNLHLLDRPKQRAHGHDHDLQRIGKAPTRR